LRRADGTPCFGYYFIDDLIAGRPAETPLHCVAIEANPATGLVLGYAEYFGIHRAVVCLGRGYSGEAVKRVYALDPRTGTELDLSVRLDFSAADIKSIYNYQMDDAAGRQSAQHKIKWKRVSKEALDYAWAHCGAVENEILTEEHKRTISRLYAERVVPFVLHSSGASEQAARQRAEAFADLVVNTA
jgi:hypothetical protein